MTWFCPTLMRPERLAELARSWETCAPGKELYVRIWDKDPRKADYFSHTWPEGWTLVERPTEYCGEAMNDFFQWKPNEKSYGFLGDDVVLQTKGGLDKLELLAEDWFLAFPNDMIQRGSLATHFCVGGKFTRQLGWLAPPGFKHGYMDNVWTNIALNCGLLRYVPDVLFEHKHYQNNLAPVDETYRKVQSLVEEGKRMCDDYMAGPARQTIIDMQWALVTEFEGDKNYAIAYGT